MAKGFCAFTMLASRSCIATALSHVQEVTKNKKGFQRGEDMGQFWGYAGVLHSFLECPAYLLTSMTAHTKLILSGSLLTLTGIYQSVYSHGSNTTDPNNTPHLTVTSSLITLHPLDSSNTIALQLQLRRQDSQHVMDFNYSLLYILPET